VSPARLDGKVAADVGDGARAHARVRRSLPGGETRRDHARSFRRVQDVNQVGVFLGMRTVAIVDSLGG
jgi:hypothetical protein